MGVDAVVKFAKDGTKATGYTDTGVTLITDKPQSGVDSKDVDVRPRQLLGLSSMSGPRPTDDRPRHLAPSRCAPPS